MQGESPKSLAVRFEKDKCVEYMSVAEADCKLPEFYKGMELQKIHFSPQPRNNFETVFLF